MISSPRQLLSHYSKLPGLRSFFTVTAAAIGSIFVTMPVSATPYQVAVFNALNKITAYMTQFDAVLDQPTHFGTLEVTTRFCDKRPLEEQPKTVAFVEIRQFNQERNVIDPGWIFKGWMFAESPGLNGLEHPVYDIWLSTCKMTTHAAPMP